MVRAAPTLLACPYALVIQFSTLTPLSKILPVLSVDVLPIIERLPVMLTLPTIEPPDVRKTVLLRVIGILAFAEPSIDTVPVASPLTPIILAVVHTLAEIAEILAVTVLAVMLLTEILP